MLVKAIRITLDFQSLMYIMPVQSPSTNGRDGSQQHFPAILQKDICPLQNHFVVEFSHT